MLSWLKANLVPVLVGIAVLMAVGTVSGWVSSARYKGMADAEAAAKVRALQDLKSAADSATAARARAHRANQRAERQREAYDSTLTRLLARIRDLGAVRDSLEAAAEREMAAHDGWLSRETHEQVVANLEDVLLVTDRMRVEAEALARTERERGDALEVQVGKLMAQVGTLETVVATQDREIVALRAADRGLLPDFGIVTKPIYAAVGAAIGYGFGRLTR